MEHGAWETRPRHKEREPGETRLGLTTTGAPRAVKREKWAGGFADAAR